MYMRKILSILSMLMLVSTLAFAQSRTVTGQVTDETGNPIPFATIVVKNTNNGTSADQNGNFSIKVNTGDVLVISSQGRTSREITIDTQTTITAALQSTNTTMTEVVVSTGYNTRRTKRSTVSNAQVVGGPALTTIRQSNLNNAL